MRHIVLIDPDEPRVWLWSRLSDQEVWTDRDVIGLDQSVDLPAIGTSLPMAEIYDELLPRSA